MSPDDAFFATILSVIFKTLDCIRSSCVMSVVCAIKDRKVSMDVFMVITCSRVWINQVSLPVLLVVS